jgi:hypothetical protein
VFVVGGSSVRVLLPGGSLSQTVLNAGAGASIRSMALDPAFQQNGRIYVGETANVAGGREFRIVRYRVVQNRGGERAALVSVPLAGAGDALFALSSSGHLYVAMPGDPATGNGALLRFNLDGTVPRDQRGGSPIIADSYPVPTAIAVDARTRQIWVAGLDRESKPSLGVLGPDFAEAASWPASLASHSLDVAVTSLAFGAPSSATVPLFAVSAGGRIEQAWRDESGRVVRAVSLTLPPAQQASAIATDAMGTPYLAVAEQAGTAPSTVLRLEAAQ